MALGNSLGGVLVVVATLVGVTVVVATLGGATGVGVVVRMLVMVEKISERRCMAWSRSWPRVANGAAGAGCNRASVRS